MAAPTTLLAPASAEHDEPAADDKKHFGKAFVNTVSGLSAGVFCAVLFNPVDRALYLSMREHRPFLLPANFVAPFRGLSQAVVHRTLSHGLYYVFQNELRHRFSPLVADGHLREMQARFLVGLCSGALNGVVLNPFAAIKYQLWASEHGSVWSTMCAKWRAGGYRPFLKGSMATVMRDVVFGCTYELSRHSQFAVRLAESLGTRIALDQGADQLPSSSSSSSSSNTTSPSASSNFIPSSSSPYQPSSSSPISSSTSPSPLPSSPRSSPLRSPLLLSTPGYSSELVDNSPMRPPSIISSPHNELSWAKFFCNTTAATCGVILSSPFNYARQRIYACPPDARPPTLATCLRNLSHAAADIQGLFPRLRFLQIQLQIGLGSLRAGVGMAVGQLIFSRTVSALENFNRDA